MSILTIIQVGDKRLRLKSTDFEPKDIPSDEIKKLISDLSETMLNEPDSAGISAPQIGVNKNLFIIRNDLLKEVQNKDEIFSVFINPKITKFSSKKTTEEEGCLSIRWQYGPVKRPLQIEMEYLDTEGKKIKKGFGGFISRVIQHEVDHLNGILFIDKAESVYKLSEREIQEMKEKFAEEKKYGKK